MKNLVLITLISSLATVNTTQPIISTQPTIHTIIYTKNAQQKIIDTPSGPITATYVEKTDQTAPNQGFPALHFHHHSSIDGWIQIVRTDAREHNLTCFLDAADRKQYPDIWPLYTRDRDFYDAPQWNPAALSRWEAHAYPVTINRSVQQLELADGIAWGFTIDRRTKNITMIHPRLLNAQEQVEDLTAFQRFIHGWNVTIKNESSHNRSFSQNSSHRDLHFDMLPEETYIKDIDFYDGVVMKTITPNELQQSLKTKHVTLIDVREPAEHRAENIPGAILIPLAEISYNRLPTHQGMIVMHCASGKRSAQACEQLEREHPGLDLYSLDGGIQGWKKAGLITQRAQHTIIPLERQIQITAGIIILAGTIMGYTINSGFYCIPGIIGTALIIAGLSGWCGMGMILSKMPWNQ